ncbi:MAG: acyltransferase [Lachnospiraceae bacterium]|nr:acyltransferase [Lachnospiraceae bacterium]
MNSGSKKTQSLQALRGLAFAGIFLGHFYYFGWTPVSVSVFFVLSGFLLTLKSEDGSGHQGFKENISSAWNRIRKLYPLHLVLMVICIPLTIYRAGYFDPMDILIKVVCNVFLIQSLVPNADIAASLNGVSWYLSTILILYIIFPYLYRAFKKIRSNAVYACLLVLWVVLQTAVLFVTYRYCRIDSMIVYLTHCCPLYRVFDLLSGMMLGFMVKQNGRESEGHFKLNAGTIIKSILEIAVIAVVGWLVFLWQNDNTNIFLSHAPVIPVISTALVWLFYRKAGFLTGLLTNKVTVFVGNLSGYAFLIHFPIVVYINTFIFPHLSVLKRTIIHGILFPGSVTATLVLSYLYATRIAGKFKKKN